jgi:CheY-like chemotaxis protein
VLNKNLPVVLLIEDSPDDIDFAGRTLARCSIAHRLVVAEQGDEALSLLTDTAANPAAAARWWPSLILLDLNTPGLAGRDLLARLKADPVLRTIPVVILSTSQQLGDIEACYRAGANSYHAKAQDFGQYQKILLGIVEYWLGTTLGAPLPGEIAGDAAASR